MFVQNSRNIPGGLRGVYNLIKSACKWLKRVVTIVLGDSIYANSFFSCNKDPYKDERSALQLFEGLMNGQIKDSKRCSLHLEEYGSY